MIKIAVLANDAINLTGMSAFLRRTGLCFFSFTDAQILLGYGSFDIVFIGNNFLFKGEDKEKFINWASRNPHTKIACFGFNNAMEEVFRSGVNKHATSNCYWPILINFNGKDYLVSLPGYEYIKVEQPKGIVTKHTLILGKGYFLDPIYTYNEEVKDAYLIYQQDNFLLFSLPIFEMLGDIFFGRANIENYKSWYDPLFWLDDFISTVKSIIEDGIGIKLKVEAREIVDNAYKGAIVLRHDVDSSRDTSYLEYELSNKLPATYAVLLDRDRQFWLSTLRGKESVEISFHYNTVKRTAVFDKITRYFNKRLKVQYKPFIRGITGSGLYRQYLKARNEGLNPETINRHGPFLILPDFYYAMEYLCKREPSVLGSGSLFRGIILKAGADRPDNINGYIGSFPGTTVPYWYPIKPFLEIAGAIKPAAFWESTHLMETDNTLVDKILNRDNRQLTKPLYVFGYHPMHARNNTFAKDGCFSWFRYLVEKAKKNQFEFLTLSQVYKRMNEIERENVRYCVD